MRHRFDVIVRVGMLTGLSLSALQPLTPVWAAGPERQAETSAFATPAEGQDGWQNLFGVMTVRTNRIAGYERWQSMLSRASAGCTSECPPAWRAWTQLVRRLDGISRYAQIKSVNWSANATLTWRSDMSARWQIAQARA